MLSFLTLHLSKKLSRYESLFWYRQLLVRYTIVWVMRGGRHSIRSASKRCPLDFVQSWKVWQASRKCWMNWKMNYAESIISVFRYLIIKKVGSIAILSFGSSQVFLSCINFHRNYLHNFVFFEQLPSWRGDSGGYTFDNYVTPRRIMFRDSTLLD